MTYLFLVEFTSLLDMRYFQNATLRLPCFLITIGIQLSYRLLCLSCVFDNIGHERASKQNGRLIDIAMLVA